MFPAFQYLIGLFFILSVQAIGAINSGILVLVVFDVYICKTFRDGITDKFWLEIFFTIPSSLTTIIYTDVCGTETGILFIAAFAAFWNLSWISVMKEKRFKF